MKPMTYEEWLLNWTRSGHYIVSHDKIVKKIMRHEFILSELLEELGDVDYTKVTLDVVETGCGYFEVSVLALKTGTEEDLHNIRRNDYNKYVAEFNKELTCEQNLYKRLHTKYGENK